MFFRELFSSEAAYYLIWYLLLVSGMYTLMRQHKFNQIFSFFTAISFVLCTGVIIWIVIGHNAKEMTFAIVPFIFVMMERIKEKVSLLNIVLLTIVMHIMLAGGHVQMIFYAAMAVGILLLCELIYYIAKKQNWLSVLKLIGVFVIATLLAALMSADRYFSVLEYTPHSTRGAAPITARVGSSDKEAVSKLTKEDYDYATMWSNSPDELIDMFVPSYHGFGKVNYKGILTNNQETQLMTY